MSSSLDDVSVAAAALASTSLSAASAASSSSSSALCSQCLYTPVSVTASSSSSAAAATVAPLCESCSKWEIRTDVAGFLGVRCMVARVDLEADELIFEDAMGLAADIAEDTPEQIKEQNDKIQQREMDVATAKAAAASDSSSSSSSSAAAAASVLPVPPATGSLASAYVSLLRDLVRFSSDVSAADLVNDSAQDLVMGAAFRFWTQNLCHIPPHDFETSNGADGAISGHALIIQAQKLFEEMITAPAATAATAAAAGGSASPSSPPLLLHGVPLTESDFIRGMIQIKMNCWQQETAGSLRRLIVPLMIASINHSCVPCAILLNGCQLYAAKPIRAGEQIFMSYLPPSALLALSATLERQRLLRRTWHFECACPRCADPDSASKTWNEELEESWIYHGFHPEYEAVCVEEGEGEEEGAAEEEEEEEEEAEQ